MDRLARCRFQPLYPSHGTRGIHYTLHNARRSPNRASGLTFRRALTSKIIAGGLVLTGCSSNGSSNNAAVADWKNPQLEGVEHIAVSEDCPLEEVASHNPDLIVGDTYRIKEEDYNELSKFADVLPGMDRNASWEPQLKALGEIYGLEDKAQEVIDADEAAFAAVREELPGLKDKTALTVQDRAGQFGVIANPDNIANAFYSRLGMTLPASFTDGSVQIDAGRAQISYERVADLSANFMGIYATEGMDKIRDIGGYEQLPQVESGAIVEDNKPVMAALNIPSSLSNAWLLEQLRPPLEIVNDEEAVDAE